MDEGFTIQDLTPADEEWVKHTAELLLLGFEENWPHAWPNLEAGLEEVKQSLQDGRISRVAVNEAGQVLGWIAGISGYNGHSWELHPLVVHPDYHGMGIGRTLVKDFEAQVLARGGTTIWLGTDDEAQMTSLGGIELYPDVLGHLSQLKNLRRHSFEFYQKLGFAPVGAIPDAGWAGEA